VSNTPKLKVLITEKFSTEAQVLLSTSGLFQLERLNSLQELPEKIATADLLIIRSKTKITKDLLTKAPHLKCIITCTSGFDHIDLVTTKEKNIAVMYTPDANATSAAELTWGLVLASARKIIEAQKNIKSGTWNREQLSGFELSGRTYGIVGLGRIGQKVAGFAKAFGMNVVAFDPYQDDEAFSKLQLQRSSYEEVLKQSDILSFHVPLTKETKNMLNRSHFEFTNRNVIIINTSRGGVVNEDDLAIALENKLIAGCALDVFEKEPLGRESKLLKAQNVVLTQHMGALTEEGFQKASEHAATAAIEFIKFNKITNSLPLVNNWGSLSFD
jgi:D-3-phosphoglycerate dehydrogenase / 2-oxoglutarate reductase